ncbi:hypothetical protein FRC12_019644 [Ceratobasidium sp. 428]|nr:hypothetical protein FRC12_019644 [Ceratobasidium sp. 428]
MPRVSTLRRPLPTSDSESAGASSDVELPRQVSFACPHCSQSFDTKSGRARHLALQASCRSAEMHRRKTGPALDIWADLYLEALVSAGIWEDKDDMMEVEVEDGPEDGARVGVQQDLDQGAEGWEMEVDDPSAHQCLDAEGSAQGT